MVRIDHREARRQSDPPNSADEVRASLMRALYGAAPVETPYRHWLLAQVLPEATAVAVSRLRIAAPVIGDTAGKRETHNTARVFLSPEVQARHPVCANVASALQDSRTVSAIANVMGADLDGSYLRIEFAQDRDGFWLEPHTDIGVKRVTLQVYLNEDETLGTDLYRDDAAHSHAGAAPAAFNCGFAFVPARDTWHGFQRRQIKGLRKSVIVNYVGPEWRSGHELAFPDAAVRAAS